MEKVLYSLSGLSLILGILILLIGKLWGVQSVKWYFRITKLSVLLSAVFRIVFYNKTAIEGYFAASSYTTMFYVFCAVAAYIWLSLSFRWFTSMNMPASGFSTLALCAVLCCEIIISTVNIGILFIALLGLSVINYFFLRFSQETEDFHQISFRYGCGIVFFSFLMLISLICLTPENWGYHEAGEFMILADKNTQILIVFGILSFLLFMLGIAPFHFGVIDVMAPAVLPVAAYLSFVPFFALWAAFLKVTPALLNGCDEQRHLLFSIFGICSLVIGALGTHSTRNIKKIFGYTGLYNMGVILIMLAIYHENSIVAAFMYMQTYILTIIGVYACFYSFKSSREYLNNISMLNGIAAVRPYISISMVLYLSSLMGFALLPGFISNFSALIFLASEGYYVMIGILLLSLLIIGSAYIRILSAMYFAPAKMEYDRPDSGIYLYLLLIGVSVIILFLQPEFLIENAKIVSNSMVIE